MAAKITAEHDITRQDTFRIHPDDIVLGVNSRVVPGPDDEAKAKRTAISIYKHGQKQPALAHRNDKGQVVLDGGFGRLKAIQLLRTGFEFTDDDGFPQTAHIADATLWVVVDTKIQTEEQAFVQSILENVHEELSPLQEARGNEVLRDKFKYSDTSIAQLRGYNNTNRVAELWKLLAAPKDVLKAVEKGQVVSVAAAIALAELPDDLRKETIKGGKKAEAEEGDEKPAKPAKPITATAARKAAEDAGIATKATQKPRNVAALEKFTEERLEGEEGKEKQEALFTAVVKWLRGKGGDQALLNAINKAFDVA